MKLKPLNPKRDFGIDALRILSMLMIVTHHLITHGGLLKSRPLFSTGYNALLVLDIAVLCAVNCYVLISGYVGLYTRHKYSSIASLWLQVFVYSFGITMLFKYYKPGSVKGTLLFRSTIPALGRMYWFFTAYFILFLVMPMLNAAVLNLSRRRVRFMLITLILFIGVFSSVYDAYYNSDIYLVNRGYAPWWMMVIYMVGAYIRKYDVFSGVKRFWFLIIFFIDVAAASSMKLWLRQYFFEKYGSFKYDTLLLKYTSLNICIAAAALFLFFRGLHFKPFVNRIIAFLAPMVFSVYLIHDHPLVRDHIIKVKLKPLQSMGSAKMIGALAVAAVGIYLACSLIDLARLWIFKLLHIKPLLVKIEDFAKKPKKRASGK